MTPVTVTEGDGPIILGLPHAGTWLPDDVMAKLNDRGRALADTDWHVDRLYDGLLDGVTTVRANFHRYLIDANRDPEGVSLYPGQNTTTLVPLTDFDGQDIWQEPPTEADIAERLAAYHTPYHAALRKQIERSKAKHGVAILYDCHSIRSKVPFLFEGTLPDFNIGTNGGLTCSPSIEEAVVGICAPSESYSHTVNGRFKGGWTTRHYGQPEQGVHAIQMELAQSTYLADEAPPWTYDIGKAEPLRTVLSQILYTIREIALSEGLRS